MTFPSLINTCTFFVTIIDKEYKIKFNGSGVAEKVKKFFKMATDSAAQSTCREQTRKSSEKEIMCLFEMAPQDGVHLQCASFWMARKSEVMSSGSR